MRYIRPQDVLPGDMDKLHAFSARQIDGRTIRVKTGPYSEDTTITGSADSIDALITRFLARYPDWQIERYNWREQ